MKIVVTGGRDYTNREHLYRVLAALNPISIRVGDCPTGVDKFVWDWVEGKTTGIKVYEADWAKHGRAAGPIRNQQMIRENQDANLVIAFPGGNGTENCVRNAIKYGLVVLRVE